MHLSAALENAGYIWFLSSLLYPNIIVEPSGRSFGPLCDIKKIIVIITGDH